MLGVPLPRSNLVATGGSQTAATPLMYLSYENSTTNIWIFPCHLQHRCQTLPKVLGGDSVLSHQCANICNSRGSFSLNITFRRRKERAGTSHQIQVTAVIQRRRGPTGYRLFLWALADRKGLAEISHKRGVESAKSWEAVPRTRPCQSECCMQYSSLPI